MATKQINFNNTSTSTKRLNYGAYTISMKDHDRLVSHILARVEASDPLRSQFVDNCERIDRDIYGFLVHDADDLKRSMDNEKGHGVKPVDVKLPLVLAQLDEALTYMAMVLAPDEGIYSAIAPADKQKVAKAFSILMNKHAERFGHYTEIVKFLFNALKYNFGGLTTDWTRVFGMRMVTQGVLQQTEFQKGEVAAGNRLQSIDPYNFLFDGTVSPLQLANQGEWFGSVEMTTPFRVRKMMGDQELFNLESLIKEDATYSRKYFRTRPRIRADVIDQMQTDWVEILTAGFNSSGSDVTGAIERGVFHIWLDPTEFNIRSAGNRIEPGLQIWRIELFNNSQIGSIIHKNNAHGLLPVSIAMPSDDGFLWQTKSQAELLSPFNMFASHQINVHQRSARKKLYGLTFYDRNAIPELADDNVDMLGGKIPVNTQGADMDIRRKVVQYFDGPDTTRTMDDIERMDALMQKVLPTQQSQQVAGLDRATQYQAAATVQSASRRNLKMAKVIDFQALTPSRHMQMFNIYQFQQQMDIVSPDGEVISADPKEFRAAQLEFVISDGLRGLDKLSLIIHLREVLNAVLQNQQAASQFDIVGIINYWTTLVGDQTDFSQFRVQSPIDKLSPEEKQVAFELLQRELAARAGGGGGQAPGQGGAA